MGTYRGAVGEVEVRVDDGTVGVVALGFSPLLLTPVSQTELYEVTLMVDLRRHIPPQRGWRGA